MFTVAGGPPCPAAGIAVRTGGMVVARDGRRVRAALGVVSIAVIIGCEVEQRPVADAGGFDLDHLVATDVGGGDAPRAWHIVFVGDGYAPGELPGYRAFVDGVVDALVDHDGGFVAMAPEAFRFARVDAVGPGWELGTHLDASDSCGEPFIVADGALVARAAANAVAAPEVVVVVAHELAGRANAFGDVHVSDRDDWHVVEHELSHALFHLGDEYTELAWCSARAPDDAELLATANVTASGDDAKWGGAVAGSLAGGARWPCLHHPTAACTMNDAEAGAYCPVCAAAVRETIAARLCRDDGAAPRVVLVDPPAAIGVGASGMTLALEAAAFDEGAIAEYRLVVDGGVVSAGPMPWADVAIDSLVPGAHVLAAEAVDVAGHVGASPPYALTITHTAGLAPRVSAITASGDADGWIRVTVEATPLGGTIAVSVGAEPVVAPILTGPFDVWVPARGTGGATVTAIARTAAGAPSPPRTATVVVAAPTAAPPTIDAITIAGADLAALAAVGPVVDVDTQITSCAPLDRIDVLDGAGAPISSTNVVARHACTLAVPVTLSPIAGPATLVLHDRFGRTATRALTLPPLADPAACGIAPALDAPTIAIAHPGELALAAPGTTVAASTVSLAGAVIPAFPATRADGTRGLLLAAGDISGAPRDGVPTDLRVTVVAACGATGLLATTSIVPAIVDAVAPTLRVHRYIRAGEAPAIDAHDGSAVTLDEAVDGDQLVVRATDAAGNITQRTATLVTFPNDRAGCP